MQGDTLGRFNDARLERVGGALLASMEQHRTLCVHRLAKDRNQAIQFGRFLDNPAVSTHEMLVHAARQTNRAASGRHVLAIQDTTELHFPSHGASKRGFGTAGNGADVGLQIPTHRGHLLRFDRGQATDLMAATIPI